MTRCMFPQSPDEKRLLRFQKQLAKYKLLIIDELGFVPLSKTGAELLFEVFSQRYERGSTLLTSNLPFDELDRGVRLKAPDWSLAGPAHTPCPTHRRSSYRSSSATPAAR